MAILSSRGHSCCSFYALPHNNRIPRKQGLSNVSGDIFGESSKAFRSCNILNWDKLKSQLTKPKMTMTMKVNVQLGKTWLRSQLNFSEEWKIKHRFSSKKAKKYFVPLFEDQTELETLWCEKCEAWLANKHGRLEYWIRTDRSDIISIVNVDEALGFGNFWQKTSIRFCRN